MKSWGQVWRDADAEDRAKIVIAFIAFLCQLPFIVLFYFIRSAWHDASLVSWWLRPKQRCKHGIDRVRQPCDECGEAEEREIMIAMQQGRSN